MDGLQVVKNRSKLKKIYLPKKPKIAIKLNVSFIKDFINNSQHKKLVNVVNKVTYKY